MPGRSLCQYLEYTLLIFLQCSRRAIRSGQTERSSLVYATALAKHFDAYLEIGVRQVNVVSHTFADAQTRILGQPVFIGKIGKGAHVLIVDDVVTYGSTLANLRGWLERQGAVVFGAPTLAAGFGGTKLALPDIVRERLSGRFPG